MPWVRLHDGAMTHPKIVSLSDKAFRLWVWGLSYCQMHLTDGLIPAAAIPPPVKTAVVLVLAHLWDAREDGGFIVHDYLDWNDSRDLVTRKRQEAKERMTNARQRRSREVRTNTSIEHSENFARSSTLGRVSVLGSEGECEGKPTPITGESLAWFDRVYAAYPNKERKEKANREWIDLNPPNDLAQDILRDIQRRVAAGWVRLERRFIPQLATFLKDRMWQDDAEAPAAYDEPMQQIPYAWTCRQCGEIHEGNSSQAKAGLCLKVTA